MFEENTVGGSSIFLMSEIHVEPPVYKATFQGQSNGVEMNKDGSTETQVQPGDSNLSSATNSGPILGHTSQCNYLNDISSPKSNESDYSGEVIFVDMVEPKVEIIAALPPSLRLQCPTFLSYFLPHCPQLLRPQ